MKVMSLQSAKLRFSIITDENGKKLEPMELAYVDVPDEFTGAVISQAAASVKVNFRIWVLSAGGYTRIRV